MKVFRPGLAVFFLLTVVSMAFGASTKSDYSKDFDFSQLHTFTFRTERDSKDPLMARTIEAQRIQNALAQQFQANGFTETSDNPDFIVAFYSRTQEKTQVNSTGFGYGRGWGWGYGVPFRGRWRWGFGPDIWTSTYTQGCVMADIIDPRKNEVVWRGVVKDTVNGVGQSDKQASSAAKDLVERFMKDTKKLEKRNG